MDLQRCHDARGLSNPFPRCRPARDAMRWPHDEPARRPLPTIHGAACRVVSTRLTQRCRSAPIGEGHDTLVAFCISAFLASYRVFAFPQTHEENDDLHDPARPRRGLAARVQHGRLPRGARPLARHAGSGAERFGPARPDRRLPGPQPRPELRQRGTAARWRARCCAATTAGAAACITWPWSRSIAAPRLGRRLVAASLRALAEAGIPKCHLAVYADNAPGQDFWRRLGALERVELSLYSMPAGAPARGRDRANGGRHGRAHPGRGRTADPIAAIARPCARDAGRSEAALREMIPNFRDWLRPRLGDGRYFGFAACDAGRRVAGIGLMLIDWPPPRAPRPGPARLRAHRLRRARSIAAYRGPARMPTCSARTRSSPGAACASPCCTPPTKAGPSTTGWAGAARRRWRCASACEGARSGRVAGGTAVFDVPFRLARLREARRLR